MADEKLPDAHVAELGELIRIFSGKAGFALAYGIYIDSAHRTHAIGYLERYGSQSVLIDVKDAQGALDRLDALFEEAGRRVGDRWIHVVGLDDWPPGQHDLWRGLNHRREWLATTCARPMVLWVREDLLRGAMTEAFDLWTWSEKLVDVARAADTAVTSRTRAVLPSSDLGHSPVSLERFAHLHEEPQTSAVGSQSDYRRLVDRAEWAITQQDWAVAEALLHAAIDGKAEIGDNRGLVDAKRVLAQLHRARGDLDAALALLRDDVVSAAEAAGDVLRVTAVQTDIAELLGALGRHDEAASLLRDVILPRHTAIDLPTEWARALDLLAVSEIGIGRLGQAAETVQQQLDAAEAAGNQHLYARAMWNYASLYKQLGEVDRAYELLRDVVLPIFSKVGNVDAAKRVQGVLRALDEELAEAEEAHCDDVDAEDAALSA
ncbi:MAG: hypothetical protein AAF772_05845 [Acidobacteriota bacterium]